MEKNKIAANIAANITYYRKQFKLTQYELAKILNYSDKSISKWERGEGVPDVFVLAELSQFFGVSINHLVLEKKRSIPVFKNRFLTASFYASIIWLLAGISFGVGLMSGWSNPSWRVFIYALPLSALVYLIFYMVWRKLRMMYIFETIFIWTLALSIHLALSIYEAHYIYIVALPVWIFASYLLFMIYQHKQLKKTTKRQKDQSNQ